MEITLNTPALLFSTVSLVYIAYTTRFVAISNLIRGLKDKFLATGDKTIIKQISNLRIRVVLIRNMQYLGVLSIISGVFSMIFLYFEQQQIGSILFAIALFFLVISLLLALHEIRISIISLQIELSSLEKLEKENKD